MKWFINFIRSFKTDNTVILKEDIEENMYYFLIDTSDRKNTIIDNTLKSTNLLLYSTFGDLMNKKLKKELVGEITLFVARLCRNYDNLPSETQFKTEFDHFIKSMIK